jgi:hypothetical protein
MEEPGAFDKSMLDFHPEQGIKCVRQGQKACTDWGLPLPLFSELPRRLILGNSKCTTARKESGSANPATRGTKKYVTFFLFWRLLYYAQLLQHAEFVRLLPHFHDLATFDPEEVKTRYRNRPTSRGNAHQLPLLGAP